MNSLLYIIALSIVLLAGLFSGRNTRFSMHYKKIKNIVGWLLEASILLLVFLIGVGAGVDWSGSNWLIIGTSILLGITVSLSSVAIGFIIEKIRGER